MNSEMYVYVVVVALIGMTTVFVGLSLLSLMMILLRRLFRVASVVPSPRPKAPAPVASEGAPGDRRWVYAAVAAFLEEEWTRRGVSASRWRPAADERSDPWIGQPRF